MSNSLNSRISMMTPAMKQRRPNSTSTAMKHPRQSTVFANATTLSPIASEQREAKSDNFEVEKAYNKYMKALLADILVDEAAEREMTEVDWKLAELAKRFEASKNLLEATNRRLKDISFQSEQQRLLDLRSTDVSSFLEYINSDNPNSDLADLTEKQKSYLNRMKLENVTVGDDAADGCAALHSAIVDAIAAFEEIKKNAALGDGEFEKYSALGDRNADGPEGDGEIDDIRREVETFLPLIGEGVLKEISESLHRFKLISEEDEDDLEEGETPVHDSD